MKCQNYNRYPLKIQKSPKGILLSILPSIIQLFIVFPLKADKGIAGLELGYLTPILVLFFNLVWGVVSAYAIKYCLVIENKLG